MSSSVACRIVAVAERGYFAAVTDLAVLPL